MSANAPPNAVLPLPRGGINGGFVVGGGAAAEELLNILKAAREWKMNNLNPPDKGMKWECQEQANWCLRALGSGWTYWNLQPIGGYYGWFGEYENAPWWIC